MIEKMTRYTFITMKDQWEDFLPALQEIGLIDITRSTKPVDDRSSEMFTRAEALRHRIDDIRAGRYTRDPHYNDLVSARAAVLKELKRASLWGEYDTEAVERLSEQGLKMRFYSVPASRFDPAWTELYPLQEVSRDKTVRFVTVGPLDGYDFPVEETVPPRESASSLQTRLEALDSDIADRMKALDAEIDDIPALQAEYNGLASGLDRYLAAQKGESAAEGALTVVEGFAPESDGEAVAKALDALDVAYVTDNASLEDNPPIKLRNNRFSRLFETITRMYGMPVYDEFDPTPILSVFFMLFFAMCMGDAGYGIILFIFGIAVNKKWVKIDMFKNIGTLISVLGAATFFVGLLLGTFFGMPLEQAGWYPEPLKKLIISGEIAGYSTQMVLSLVIGVFHICLAMIIKTALHTRQRGFKNSLSTWGWTLLTVGTVVALAAGALLHLGTDTTRFIIIVIAVLSALGIFIFNKPGRNPLINVGAGLWDTYQMVTGLLGDVLSYLRLYALGLAGGMLGGAFNDLAVMVLGGNPTWQWIPFAVILLFGHVLNILMSCLGAFVHPLRLTFVEYFKNSGYEGAGRQYNPLAKIK